MNVRAVIAVCLAVCGMMSARTSSASDALTAARRALADGLWAVAETNAVRAAETPAERTAARLVQLEALAGAGRYADLLACVDRWPEEKTEGFRYWRVWALVRTRAFDTARTLLEEKPFTDAEYKPLAARLAARLEREAGAPYDAVTERYRIASRAQGSNAVTRTENALEWAEACLAFNDTAAARTVLETERACEMPGAAGDDARLLAARLAAASGDADGAHRWRARILADGGGASERAYVLAAGWEADALWAAGQTNAALAMASNAAVRATRPDLVRAAGYRLGFYQFRHPPSRDAGRRLVQDLLRRYVGAPESRVAHRRFADQLRVAGEAAAAEREYAALLQVYPVYAHDPYVLAGRGWALLELGRRTEAVGLFARAAQVATNAVDRAFCRFKQADALLADGRFAEAATVYAHVAEDRESPLAGRARFQRADALARAGETEKARELFYEIFEKEGSVAAGMRAATLESAAGRLERAVDLYDRLVEKVPETDSATRENVLFERGKVLYGAYRFEAAEKDFAAVAALRPARKAEMAFLSALCQYGAGHDAAAAEAARTLLTVTTDEKLRAEVRFWLAKYAYGHRRYAEARDAFAACATNAYLSAARRIESFGRAARACASLADYAGVVEYATRAATNAVAVRAVQGNTPETAAVADVFVLQGEALMELARFSEAVLVLDRVARLTVPPPLTHRAAMLRADCLFAMGADDERRYRQALEAYRALLREKALSPSLRIAAAFKVGRALEKLNLGAEAVDQYYVQVVTAYCDGLRGGTWYDVDARTFFSRAAFMLADYYETRGESRQAVRVLEYVIKADVPAAVEARRRIARLTKKGGVW